MPINVNPESATSNWVTALSAAGAKYEAGIDRVRENPMEKAAAMSGKYLAGVQEAVQTGRYQAALRAVPFDFWKTAARQKGAQRLAGGAQAARPKMRRFFDTFLPYLSEVVDRIRAMPNNTFEERVQRATQYMRDVHEFRAPPGA